MEDGNGRVRAHAVAVVINYCEGVETVCVEEYLEALLGKLAGLLADGWLNVVENSVLAVAAVCECVGSLFVPVCAFFFFLFCFFFFF